MLAGSKFHYANYYMNTTTHVLYMSVTQLQGGQFMLTITSAAHAAFYIKFICHITGNFRKVFNFGHFEEALLFENKFPHPVVL